MSSDPTAISDPVSRALEDEQTLIDRDQTLADTDHTWSDSDQTASDREQAAANSDQAASDRDLVRGGDPDTHGSSREIRSRTAQQRQFSAEGRIAAATARDQVAHARDLTALARDQTAELRDRALATQDAAMVGHDSEMTLRAADNRSSAATDRAVAAESRTRAAADREQAARDRDGAARELLQAQAERNALLAQLASAETDGLTGTRSRATGLEDFDHEIARARRAMAPLAIAYIDVVGLKAANDAHGHGAGDALLQHAVNTIRGTLRSYDLIVRIGGDEFICVMSGATIEYAHQRFAAIQTKLAANPYPCEIKVGFAALTDADTAADLIQRADAELPPAPGARDATPRRARGPVPRRARRPRRAETRNARGWEGSSHIPMAGPRGDRRRGDPVVWSPLWRESFRAEATGTPRIWRRFKAEGATDPEFRTDLGSGGGFLVWC